MGVAVQLLCVIDPTAGSSDSHHDFPKWYQASWTSQNLREGQRGTLQGANVLSKKTLGLYPP